MSIDCLFGINRNKCCNIVENGNYRISIITDRVVRFEYSKNKTFCDEPTQIFINRDFGNVDYEVIDNGEFLEVNTEHIHLKYNKLYPSEFGLQITQFPYLSQDITYKYGLDIGGNLGGTARTLDVYNGKIHESGSEIKLTQGLISRNGYSVIFDTDSHIVNEDGSITEKSNEDYIDFYYFGFGNDYSGAIDQFYQMSGYPKAIDKHFLGNWWSRYWEYDEDELKQVVTNFEANDIPLAVSVIDMDWHTIREGAYGAGWTGFTWNKSLFPDVNRVMKWHHDKNIKVALNLHPADGFRDNEELFDVFKNELNLDTVKVEFDVTNKKFMDLYFEKFIDQQEKNGVDVWWMDWQQGTKSKIQGLDPLWMVNHLHYINANKEGKNGISFSRFAGIGSHRYPIGFSGDTYMTWDTLAYLPEFTAKSANVGYNYWSHDIGGHFHGVVDPELYVRSVQLGIFSPIFRLHSSKNMFVYKEPWRYETKYFEIARENMRLRHMFIPYINTMNNLLHVNKKQLVRPLYHDYNDDWRVYDYNNTFLFGTELLIVPVVNKINPIIKRAKTKSYLPKGKWYDQYMNVYNGECEYLFFNKINDINILNKAGSIVPLNMDYKNAHHKLIEKCNLIVFPGTGEFTLYEENVTFTTKLVNNVQEINIIHNDDYKINEFVVEYKTNNIITSNTHQIEKIDNITYQIKCYGDDNIILEIMNQEKSYLKEFEALCFDISIDVDLINFVFFTLKDYILDSLEFSTRLMSLELDVEIKEILLTFANNSTRRLNEY